MISTSDAIRRACEKLSNKSYPRLPEKSFSDYSSRLRESCRKLSDKPSFDVLSCGNAPNTTEDDTNPVSNAKRHKKFILAKLELRQLQEQYSKYLLNSRNKVDTNIVELQRSQHVVNFRLPVEESTKKQRKIHNNSPHSILKKNNIQCGKANKRVTFSPDPLFWDSALEGDLEALKHTSYRIRDYNTPNFSGITALHNAAISGSLQCVQFLVELGCSVNIVDDFGWTPLHYGVYYGNLSICDYLVQSGANVYAQTLDEKFTPYDICKDIEQSEVCAKYLLNAEQAVGCQNNGIVYSSNEYKKHQSDELSLEEGEMLKILRRGDEKERYWWWAKKASGNQGYVPFSLLTVPKILYN